MPVFEYKAYDNAGNTVSGETQSDDIEAAQQKIASQGLLLVSLKPKSTSAALTLFSSDKLSLNDLEFITSELALLLRSGVKIDRSLHILSKGKTGSASGRLLEELSVAVKRGESLTDAL